jgi:hypothetical protein
MLAGVQRLPGLRLSSTVAVPSLNIPASRVEVVVAGSNGVVQPNITMQWTSSISPVRFVNLTGVMLTVSQGAGSVSAGIRHRQLRGWHWDGFVFSVNHRYFRIQHELMCYLLIAMRAASFAYQNPLKQDTFWVVYELGNCEPTTTLRANDVCVVVAPLQSWSAAGALVDVPVAVQMTVTNTTTVGRVPIRLSATVGFQDSYRLCT